MATDRATRLAERILKADDVLDLLPKLRVQRVAALIDAAYPSGTVDERARAACRDMMTWMIGEHDPETSSDMGEGPAIIAHHFRTMVEAPATVDGRAGFLGAPMPVEPVATDPIPWEAPDEAIVVEAPTYANPFARYTIRCDERQAIVRNDTGAVLGVPTDGYAIVDNGEMGEVVEAILEADGGSVKFDTAGSVMGGKRVFTCAYLDEPVKVGGDAGPTLPYLTVLNSHDGSGAVRVMLSMVRVVCANTFQMAESEGDAHGWHVSLRHTGDVQGRIAEAVEMIARAREGAAFYVEQMDELAKVTLTPDLVDTFLDDFIPIPEGASERTRSNRQQRRGEFLGILRDSPTTDGVRDTGYGLYQAVGEYMDHFRPYRSTETYLKRTMFHTPGEKARSLGRVRELVLASL